MCFTITKKHPQVSKIAEKNITVFKCMFYNYYTKLVTSPYQGFTYSQNKLQNAINCSLKNEGGLYSFRRLNTAKEWINGFDVWNNRRKCRVFKCVIPKGSRYIEGYQYVHGDLRKCIRSKQIIFKEVVPK